MEHNSKLTIIRSHQYVNSLRAYQVILNKNEIGKINDSDSREFTVPSGKSKIKIKIDKFYSSNLIEIDLEPNKSYTLLAESNIKGWRYLIYFIYLIFLPSKFLSLKLISKSS